MTQHLDEIVVPERAINITVEGDEDASVMPVDARLLTQLLASNGSLHADAALGDNRHPEAQIRSTEAGS